MVGPSLTPEEEAQKRAIYEAIPPRRRKFIDKMGYDNWDPFQKPFDPIDIRVDDTRRTSTDLMREFMHSFGPDAPAGTDWTAGAWEMAVGVINGSSRFQGIFAFCLWYAELLRREGQLEAFLQTKKSGNTP